MLKINRQYFFGQWLMWKTEENCANPNFNAKSKPIPNRNLGEGASWTFSTLWKLNKKVNKKLKRSSFFYLFFFPFNLI